MALLNESEDILVVDDEPAIADVVSLYLKREGWTVRIARDGQAALQAIEAHLPTLIVLDLNLPQVPGLEILRHLRNCPTYVLVIILTDQSQEADRIRGLDMGADDYVSKPFSTAELVSRVKAVLRRARNKKQTTDTRERPLQCGDLIIDPVSRTVQVRGVMKELTATEFNLLYFLARHPHQVFTHEQLMEKVWEYPEAIDADTVYVHIRRLRQKIESNPKHPMWIHTVWGTGYKFEVISNQ